MSPRILFVTPSAYLLSGLATWLDYLEVGLKEKGWDVIIGLVEGVRYHRPVPYLKSHPHKQPLAIPCRTGTPAGRFRAVVKAVKKVNPDVVAVVNIPDVYPAVAYLRHKRGSSTKVVMTNHGIQADLYLDIRRYCNVIDGVIATNRLASRLSKRIGNMPGDRVFYAPYGVPPGSPRIPPSRGDRLKIAYAGRVEQWQKRIFDIPGIVESLVEMKVPFELTVAGDGPDADQLKTTLQEYIETGRVKFLGLVDPQRMDDIIYSKTDVLLITSQWETGPLVMFEAMARAVPVVTSQYVGARTEDVLRHEENALIFPVGDTRAAANELSRIWKDSQFAHRMAVQGYTMVNSRFSIRASVVAWDKAFRDLLHAPCLPRPSTEPTFEVSGKLDTWFGPIVGERIRSLIRRSSPDDGPWCEWPHSQGAISNEDPRFWEIAEQEDLRSPEEPGAPGSGRDSIILDANV